MRRQLRPFFSFYGGKWRDALRNYPSPTHPLIVEPFAGSAGYALRYFDRRVTLCEIDPIIFGVWHYLTRVKASEIIKIPDVHSSVDDLKLCQEARWLIGFWLNRGASSPKKRPSKWMRSGIRPGSFWGERVRETIASQLDAIRHWRVIEGDYRHVCRAWEATWFVDPPYVGAGKHYRYGADLDRNYLAAWCIARRGQLIVCENEGATWLPFQCVAQARTTRNFRSSESVYIR